jgi:hypothetical protein
MRADATGAGSEGAPQEGRRRWFVGDGLPSVVKVPIMGPRTHTSRNSEDPLRLVNSLSALRVRPGIALAQVTTLPVDAPGGRGRPKPDSARLQGVPAAAEGPAGREVDADAPLELADDGLDAGAEGPRRASAAHSGAATARWALSRDSA